MAKAKSETAVLESKVKDKINKDVEAAYPGTWRFMPVQTGMGRHGIPDHLFCVPVEITPEMVGRTYGMFVGIEAKKLKEKPTARQYLELAAIIRAGGFGQYCAGRPNVEKVINKMRIFFCQV